MSPDYFFSFFPCFAGSALILWLLGAACFPHMDWRRSIFHAPWLGFGLLVGALQISHLVSPVDGRFSTIFVAVSTLLALGALLIRRFGKPFHVAQTPRVLGWLLLLGVVGLIAFVPVFNSCTKE